MEGCQESFGKRLLGELNVRQGCCLDPSVVSQEKRDTWIDSRSIGKYRHVNAKNKIKDTYVLAVLSQDCDISCASDSDDPCIEVAVFFPVRKVSDGVAYAKSVRRLQLNFNSSWYETKPNLIIHVSKEDLYAAYKDHRGAIYELSDENRESLIRWRTSRYLRPGLPDQFCHHYLPVLGDIQVELEKENFKLDGARSCVRALYIYLDSLEEKDSYVFSIFALLHDDASNDMYSAVMDLIEDKCHLLSDQSGYEIWGQGAFVGYPKNVTLAFISQHMKINLDYLSLRDGDVDVDGEY